MISLSNFFTLLLRFRTCLSHFFPLATFNIFLLHNDIGCSLIYDSNDLWSFLVQGEQFTFIQFIFLAVVSMVVVIDDCNTKKKKIALQWIEQKGNSKLICIGNEMLENVSAKTYVGPTVLCALSFDFFFFFLSLSSDVRYFFK